MAGKSPVTVDEEQRQGLLGQGLLALSHSRDRGEADRARAILLTLSGWTTVGLDQRPDCPGLRGARGYGSGLAQHLHDGRDRSAEEIGRAGARSRQSRVRIGRGRGGPVRAGGGSSQLDAAASGGRDREARRRAPLALAALSCAAPKGGFPLAACAPHPERPPGRGRGGPGGPTPKAAQAQAEAGDIGLLFGDESEALTHPYLAHVWAKKGADLRIPAPGQSAKVAMLGMLDWARRDLIVRTSRTKRSSDFIALLEEIDRRFGPKLGVALKPIMLVLDNGPIHTSTASRAALAARAHWLTVEWLPKDAPELNDIEVLWRDLKRHHRAHQTFARPEDLDQAIHDAVRKLNTERNYHPLANRRIAA
jgi:transposase